MEEEYIYYWYHHMSISPKEREEINEAIMQHDYDKFIEYYKKWNSYGVKNGNFDDSCEFSNDIIYMPLTYFPDYVWNPDTEEELNILEKENFNKITYSEYECG